MWVFYSNHEPIFPFSQIYRWRIVDSDSDKAKQSSDESPECKPSNGSVPAATATSDELPAQPNPPKHEEQQPTQLPAEQPPKVNGLKHKEAAAVKHNNNNIINNNNNNKNGLVNGNAKKDEPKTAKQHKVDKKEEKGKKPKLNGNIAKNSNAKTAEKLAAGSTTETEQPPLPKRPKLDKAVDEVTKPKANGQVVQLVKAPEKPPRFRRRRSTRRKICQMRHSLRDISAL